MKLCIVGGALQGMEAVYLAKKAGYHTAVIDRRENAPALFLCDEPYVFNPIISTDLALSVFRQCDAVLPACEEHDLLEFLNSLLKKEKIPFLFDLNAYDISQSKIRSNAVMEECGVPLPGKWPECGFPAVVKPSSQSGSIGVTVAHDSEGIEKGLSKIRELDDEPVIQEFVHGKSVSIEVVGDGKRAKSYVVTEVVLDEGYDCKEVRCFPNILTNEQKKEFSVCSEKIATTIGLSSLMDAEAILTPKGLRFLEIDARIPSQTPAAILTATGINLLRVLAEPDYRPEFRNGAGIYWHLYFKDGILTTTGEKTFSRVRNPKIVSGLFGSDDAITDYVPGATEWYGTFMVSADTPEVALKRRQSVIDGIDCQRFVDSRPEEV